MLIVRRKVVHTVKTTSPNAKNSWIDALLCRLPVLQKLPEHAPLHRIRGDVAGAEPGGRLRQAAQHQPGPLRLQRLRREEALHRGQGHHAVAHVSLSRTKGKNGVS